MHAPRHLAMAMMTLIVITPLVARGGPPEDAQPHIDRAMQAHADGKFAAALAELQVAYGIDPQPELLYAIGQVYVKLDNCPQAIAYYERFLATLPDDEAVSQSRGAIAACKGRKAGRPPRTGTTPAQLTPAPATTTTTTTTTATAQPDVTAQPDSTTPSPAPAVPAAASPVRRSAPEPTEPPEQHRWYQDKLGNALVLGGVVLTVAGVFVYRGAANELDEAEAATSLARYEELVDAAHSRRTYSVVLIGGGLAVAAAGVVHYVLHGRVTEPQNVAVIPLDRGGAVTWSGRF